MPRPSLYEILYGNFAGGLALNQVGEEEQGILNSRAGSLKRLPGYGLPDMTTILQGIPGTAHQLMRVLSDVLLKYEPRIKRVDVTMQEQTQPGELHYVIDAELKDAGLVRYGTTFMPEGRVLLRHLKQQRYVQTWAGAGRAEQK